MDHFHSETLIIMKRIYLGQSLFLFTVLLPQAKAAVFLGTADGFAVFAGTSVVSTGGSVVIGDMGVYPGLTITGFAPGVVVGVTYSGGSVAQQAQVDALAAFTALGNETSIQNLTGIDLGSLSLGPGVRNFDTTAQLTGTLTLDAGGNSAARFDFLIGTTLTSAAASSINLINGARADNVYWRIGTSSTLGAGTVFSGSLLADQSITLNAGASVSGRLFAINGTTTLDNNAITDPSAIPEVETFWSLGILCSVAGAWRWAGKRSQVLRTTPAT